MITDSIRWLGHSSFRIDGRNVIYFDPFRIDEGRKADIILISHKHYDHCSKEDVKKIYKNGTMIVCDRDSAKILGLDNMVIVKPFDRFTVNGVDIEAVPAYNTNKPNHPKENEWLGFVVKTERFTVYHAGDTDVIDEMKRITCDVALLPIFPNDKYVMSPKEAAYATHIIKTKIAVPMHYGTLGGSLEDAEEFRRLSNPGIIIKIMVQEKNSF